jgi:hypothetical protein
MLIKTIYVGNSGVGTDAVERQKLPDGKLCGRDLNVTEQMLLKRFISGDATDEFGVGASTELFHEGSFTEFDRSLSEVQLHGD